MTDHMELELFRAMAKHYARGNRIPLHQALDIIAQQCGQPHWNALMSAWNSGWRPDEEQLNNLVGEERGNRMERDLLQEDISVGEINGEPYELRIGFDDVLIGGNGWGVYLGHAPSEAPKVERYTKPNPLDDEAFFQEVMKVAHAAADKVRQAISHDWPRRSTKPDADGKAVHPLFKQAPSAEWFCLHCDEKSSSAQMAANMWHCPKCSATPIDIHSSRWWKCDAV